jgi:uncharacterized protein
MTADPLSATDRSTLRRKRERGSFDRAVVNAILDEGLVCHVALAGDGQPVITPMTYARIGDALYVHGAPGNRTLRSLADGDEACVIVTLLDALVLARSAFHHSMNYRSVVLFGRAESVEDLDQKRTASAALLRHLAPGREHDARMPTDAELRSTLMVRFPISEGSAKVRTGPPLDDPEDMDLGIWAGEIPLHVVAGTARPDPGLGTAVALPAYAEHYPERPAR